jgi:SPP1 family predicted phage head-tail adaptor
MVEAGRLDRRVQFRRASLTDDGFGKVETFADFGDPVSAHKRDVSDGEKYRAGEVAAHLTTRFQVRSSQFTRGVTPKDILECEGREYNIYGIKELEGRKRLLEITAGVRLDK